MSEGLTEVAIKALIRSGALGIVLAWALWQNFRLVDRVFTVVDNNTKAMVQFQNSCAEKLGVTSQ